MGFNSTKCNKFKYCGEGWPGCQGRKKGSGENEYIVTHLIIAWESWYSLSEINSSCRFSNLVALGNPVWLVGADKDVMHDQTMVASWQLPTSASKQN